MYRLQTSVWLPISMEEAWDFFSRPENLAAITPAEMRFEILEGDGQRTYAGQLIRYRVRPLWSIPLNWTTEITHCVEGEYFIDEQRFGPYKFWHHQHHFESKDGGVLMRDDLHYNLYGGPIADILQRLMVGPRVEAIFRYREQRLCALFGAKETVLTAHV